MPAPATAGTEIKAKGTAKARQGAPRWMWTFADLMSLLFALFVLLVSFADFDPKKFERTAGPMREAFNNQEGGDAQRILSLPGGSGLLDGTSNDILGEKARQREIWREEVILDLRSEMHSELSADLVELIEDDSGVTIRFPSNTTFGAGGAALSNDILPTLDRINDVLRRIEGDINVAGHTDNVPLTGNGRYRSNWDLSTARAVSVVHYLLGRGGIETNRISAQGYAESRPLVPNSSPENQALNRRVEVSVSVPTRLETTVEDIEEEAERREEEGGNPASWPTPSIAR